jgi:hypothetical protein
VQNPGRWRRLLEDAVGVEDPWVVCPGPGQRVRVRLRTQCWLRFEKLLKKLYVIEHFEPNCMPAYRFS